MLQVYTGTGKGKTTAALGRTTTISDAELLEYFKKASEE